MSRDLEGRVEDVLAIAREETHDLDWERRMKGALAQVFFLGMSVGWDKCAATNGKEDS